MAMSTLPMRSIKGGFRAVDAMYISRKNIECQQQARALSNLCSSRGFASLNGASSLHRRHGGFNRRMAPRRVVVRASMSPQRRMSMKQRMRAWKYAIEEQRQKLLSQPPLSYVVAAVIAVRQRLQPIFDLLEKLQTEWEKLLEVYSQYIAEESKAKWAWSKRYRKELTFWAAVPQYILAFISTILYEAFIPVSVLCAFVMPFIYSWICWDRWWVSPVFLAMIIMMPLKFVPWASDMFCWIWPGII